MSVIDLAAPDTTDLLASALAAPPVPDLAHYAAPAPRPPARVDWEAEHALLGALILEGNDDSRDAWTAASALLSDADFHDPVHAEVWRALAALYEGKRVVDVVTLAAQLRARDRMNTVGGSQYLGELTDGIVTTAHVAEWAALLAEEAAARRLGTKLREQIHRLAHGERVTTVRDGVMEHLRALRLPMASATPRLGDDALAWSEELQRRLDGEEQPAITTGHADLDDALGGGLRPGLTLLGARPRVGKTAWALEAVLRQASIGRAGYILSLEMSRRELWRATVACVGEVSLSHLQDPRLISASDETRWVTAANLALTWPVFVDALPTAEELARAKAARRAPPPDPPRTLAAIRRRLDSLPQRPAFVVLDHVGKLESTRQHRDERSRYKEIAEGLHELAQELGVPIIALAHLKRAPVGKDGTSPKPTMESLGEASYLEANADAVVIFHREDLYPSRRYEETAPAPEGQVDVLVAKVRGSAANRVARLRFHGAHQRFHSTRQEDAPWPTATARPGVRRASDGDALDSYGAGDGLPDAAYNGPLLDRAGSA